MTPDTDPLRTAKGIVWALPVPIALWGVLLLIVAGVAYAR